MVVDAIRYNAEVLGDDVPDAFVVMPNQVALPRFTNSLKGITAKRANVLLGLTGQPFSQEESYDHLGG